MKTFLQILILFVSVSIFGQATQNIGYQAVVRNATNQLVQNQNIKIKVSLMTGATGVPFYVETHTTQTNTNGLFNIQIGGGTAEAGNYTNAIYWAGGNHFVKTEIDPLGGSNYSITSTTQLLSVPYANYSNTTGYAFAAGGLAGLATNFQGMYKAFYSGVEIYLTITYLGSEKVLCQFYGIDQDGSENGYAFLYAVINPIITNSVYITSSTKHLQGDLFGDVGEIDFEASLNLQGTEFTLKCMENYPGGETYDVVFTRQ